MPPTRKKSRARKESPAHKRAPARKAAAREDEGSEAGERHISARPDEMPPEVLEFIQAIDEYKRVRRRPFPTWSEVLDIVKTLGYQRAS